MKIDNIRKFLEFMSMANASTLGKDEWQMLYPSGTENWEIPHPIPGGTLGDSLDTPISNLDVSNQTNRVKRLLI